LTNDTGPISGEKLNSWLFDVSELVTSFTEGFEATYGYEPGVNEVVRAGGDGAFPDVGGADRRGLLDADVHSDLIEFYGAIQGVSLPDLGNGYFVHTPDTVANPARFGFPNTVSGALNGRIAVFGSDGGGGLLAVQRSDGRVYRLSGGSLNGTAYDVENFGVEMLAPDLWTFLVNLRHELAEATRA
jgi:hypothetical protein